MAKKKRKRTGPKEERLKIDANWEEAARILVTKKPDKKQKAK